MFVYSHAGINDFAQRISATSVDNKPIGKYSVQGIFKMNLILLSKKHSFVHFQGTNGVTTEVIRFGFDIPIIQRWVFLSRNTDIMNHVLSRELEASSLVS